MELGPFWTGDRPVNPILIDIDTDADLTVYDTATATLYDPAGVLVTTFPASAPQASAVTFQWPTDGDLFEVPGIHTLSIVLTGDDGARLRLENVSIVIEAPTGWHTLASARALWVDAPTEDVALYTLLDAAKQACINYAPVIVGTIPLAYKQAQLLQARSIWTFTKTNGEGAIGPDGYSIPQMVFPLDKNIRQLLRPKKGAPVIR